VSVFICAGTLLDAKPLWAAAVTAGVFRPATATTSEFD